METKSEANSKYRILSNILKRNNFEFALIIFSQGLKQKCKDGYVDSGTKRIIDAGIKEVKAICDDKRKQKTIENYAHLKGCNLINIGFGDLAEDLRRGIVFINGNSPKEQDPGLMHHFKRAYLESTVLMVLYNWICDESPLDKQEKAKVAIHIYAMVGVGARITFRMVMKKFKQYVKCKVDLREYTKTSLRKFLIVITSDACNNCDKRYDCWTNRC